jgi:hypothetical protein
MLQLPNFSKYLVLLENKVLILLEAAIGIEPMNKGFAVRPGELSLSVMECHRPVFIDLLGGRCYSVILKIAPDPPQKSPQ